MTQIATKVNIHQQQQLTHECTCCWLPGYNNVPCSALLLKVCCACLMDRSKVPKAPAHNRRGAHQQQRRQSPVRSSTTGGSCCSHMPPNFKLASPVGRSLMPQGDAGRMSSDTDRCLRSGRYPRAMSPLSRHAWLADDNSSSVRDLVRPVIDAKGSGKQ